MRLLCIWYLKIIFLQIHLLWINLQLAMQTTTLCWQSACFRLQLQVGKGQIKYFLVVPNWVLPKKKGSMNFQLLNAYLKCEVSYCSCHCQEFKQNNSYCISQGTGNRSVGIRLSLFFRQTFSDCRLYLKENLGFIDRIWTKEEKKRRKEEKRVEKRNQLLKLKIWTFSNRNKIVYFT